MKTVAMVIAGAVLAVSLTACGGYTDPASKYKSKAACEAAGYEWDNDLITKKKKVGTKTRWTKTDNWHCESD